MDHNVLLGPYKGGLVWQHSLLVCDRYVAGGARYTPETKYTGCYGPSLLTLTIHLFTKFLRTIVFHIYSILQDLYIEKSEDTFLMDFL